MRPRKLTEQVEDELLEKVNQRILLRDKMLCERYNVSRSTLLAALERARSRAASKAVTP